MASLTTNINQLNSDLQKIKDKIIELGIDMPSGTKTEVYADKIQEAYDSKISAPEVSARIEDQVLIIKGITADIENDVLELL